MTRHLLLVDPTIEPTLLDGLRGVLERHDRTVQVVCATKAVRLLALLSTDLFASVGVVFHGPGIPSWLLDGPMAQAINRCLAPRGCVDLLGCSVRPEDLTLSALYTVYRNHPVYASADVTGTTGNWTLELWVQDGGRVSLDQTRNLAHSYFTAAVCDLDVQLFGFGSGTDNELSRRWFRAGMKLPIIGSDPWSVKGLSSYGNWLGANAVTKPDSGDTPRPVIILDQRDIEV